jgi:hypothetical protein
MTRIREVVMQGLAHDVFVLDDQHSLFFHIIPPHRIISAANATKALPTGILFGASVLSLHPYNSKYRANNLSRATAPPGSFVNNR